ncbi:MAG: long-chain fatty acid--CoA ligase [Candidatus Abyssobacteria bacterium SURF_5]|uniref:Long-chain fatty acid--CoA ligase n=1 Tax=Abyssobacteria bacterium (strain SURF_5) TaxID=2093360 RepID=A0A3A4P6H1_ABYX5|nr:MAG: long-chain fatty acid--CoA ligase [Candidatus Abyssubacteria bacterium SURF_5]
MMQENPSMDAHPWFKFYDKHVPKSLDYPRMTIYQMLEDARRKFPANTATIFYGARHTYSELGARVDAFAAALKNLGISQGDRVALMLPTSPQFVIGYFAILKLGAIVVPTNPLYVERELEHQFNDSGAKAVVCLDLMFGRIKNIWKKTKLQYVIITSMAEEMPMIAKVVFKWRLRKQGVKSQVENLPGVLWFKDLLKTPPDNITDAASHDDIAMLQYTGGTTGISKGVMLTHRNMVANVDQNVIWRAPDIEPGKNTVLCVLPFFHVYGLCSMLCYIRVGAAMVLLPRFDVNETLKALHKYRPQLFAAVPTILVAINSHPRLSEYKLDSIKSVNCGAAPLPVEVMEQFEKKTGAVILEGFGMSETSPGLHSNPYLGPHKAGSVGIPMSDTDAKIMDLETGERELPMGEAGELVVRGPQVMKGYWNRPDETAACLRDGWLYTGDIARMDSDGYFYIVDRKKDMIIAGGFNIYPREIDEVLFEHPKVKEAVSVGIPDQYRGETVKAYIVLKDGETATEKEIIDFCRERLTRYKVPTQVEFRPELPKTLVGKILRRALREEEMKKSAAEEAKSPSERMQ